MSLPGDARVAAAIDVGSNSILLLAAATPVDGGPIDPGRAAILPTGACILAGVGRALGTSSLRVSDHGVRHAYLRERLAAVGTQVTMRALWG